ncbi:MAG: dTMP kinase [Alphaproteobacteria bacterium]
MARRGTFITLEGGEGTGKSTQINLLSQRLAEADIDHILTREPGGTSGAEAIRDLVVTGNIDRWSPKAELLLFTAARLDHLERVILPALQAGQTVICDRYIDSSVAYQGVAGGVGAQRVMALSDLMLPEGWLPDITFILDLDVTVGLARAANRGGTETRFEEKGTAFHTQLAQSFRHIAEQNPERCILVEATEKPQHVADIIWQQLAQRMGLV